MKLGSIKENIQLEKRVSITPDIIKKYKGTPAAKLARYSAGMAYLNLKEYKNIYLYNYINIIIDLSTYFICFNQSIIWRIKP